MSVVNAIPLIAAGDDGYSITRSLRFRSSASAYLNRTFGTPTSGTTWTYSCWVKRATLSTIQSIFSGGDSDFRFDVTTNLFSMSKDGTVVVSSTAVFRDPSAWMHVVLVSNGATVKAYVNSTEAFSYTGTNPDFNSAVGHTIGRYAGGATEYLDGYLTEVNFIDGQALAPTAFGAFSIYNQWLPKKYAGTYGTNGFYLPFTNNASAATLGNDFSGNSNTWTTNNISVTAGSTYDSMTDVPTLTSATAANFATLNPIANGGTISAGNLTTTGGDRWSVSTIGMESGKWYAEVAITTVGTESSVGIATRPWLAGEQPLVGNLNSASFGYWNNGNKANNSNSAYGASYTTGDVIGIAFDRDTGTLTFYKNNTSQGTAFTGLTSGTYFFAVEGRTSGTANNCSINFGQRPFTYTPPTGYLALNTFNL